MTSARRFESSSHQQIGVLCMLECGPALDGLFLVVQWELYLGQHFSPRVLGIRISIFVCFATIVVIFGRPDYLKVYY